MMTLQRIEEQYRSLLAQMEQSRTAIEQQDLEAVEACALGIDQALAVLAQDSVHLEELVIAIGEEPAQAGLAEAIRQAVAQAEQNRASIQAWIGQMHETLTHMSRGGKALSGYAASGPSVDAEFLNASG